MRLTFVGAIIDWQKKYCHPTANIAAITPAIKTDCLITFGLKYYISTQKGTSLIGYFKIASILSQALLQATIRGIIKDISDNPGKFFSPSGNL